MVITEVVYYGFESELLEAHLAEHRPYVDRLIVAECDRTTTGYPKPLFFNDNKSRYEKYDVEHIIIPNHLYTPVTHNQELTWGTQFRMQDSVKKKYVHPLVCNGADWIFHNDTDEIINCNKWDEIRASLTAHQDWLSAQLYPTLLYCFVNVIGKRKDRHSYRWFKAVEGDHIVNVKGKPRGALLEGETAGWHFHNCYSTPEDLYWAAWNRLEWWEGPMNVPDMEFWKHIHSKKGEVYKEQENSVVMQSLKEYLIYDDPVKVNPLPKLDLSDLPKYIRDNIDKFPVYKDK